jgi:two-component system LytT family response regulator
VLIVDDEDLARQRLKALLSRRAEFELVGECSNGADAVRAIASLEPDIVLLDVQMPELDGFDVIAALEHLPSPPSIVFTTAYASYALRAFEVGAIDYLLKPFDAGRFAQALARAETRRPRAAAVDPAVLALLGTMRGGETTRAERFLVRGPKRLYFVRTEDIEWADAQGNYVRLHALGRTHLVRDTITAFAAKLPPDRFVRVHRSVVVNVDRIQHLEPHARGEYVITLRDGARVTSSRAYGGALHALLR